MTPWTRLPFGRPIWLGSNWHADAHNLNASLNCKYIELLCQQPRRRIRSLLILAVIRDMAPVAWRLSG